MPADLVSAEEARGLLEGATEGDRTICYDGTGHQAFARGSGEALFHLDTEGDARLHAAAPALARTVVALSEERDRLTRILACERGEWAPEGWKWRRIRDEAWVGFDDDDGVRAWCRGRSTRVVRSTRTGRWTTWTLMPGMCDCWDEQADKDHAPTALEAIEAADAAAREVSGG